MSDKKKTRHSMLCLSFKFNSVNISENYFFLGPHEASITVEEEFAFKIIYCVPQFLGQPKYGTLPPKYKVKTFSGHTF